MSSSAGSKSRPEKALVTGGAGFIGSSLVERLVNEGVEVTVLDNYTAPSGRKVIDRLSQAGRVRVVKGDCNNADDCKTALLGMDTVFHLAANPEVRLDRASELACFRDNISATFNMLEAVKRSSVKTVVFTSSSTVYGEPGVIPTPEDYGPLVPISVYGASKVAAEALISAYCMSFQRRGVIFRLANIIGERSQHGVVKDFIGKLRNNHDALEILGDGSQRKSYLYVDDCVDGIITGVMKGRGQVSIYNIGAKDFIPVSTVATLVASAMGLSRTRQVFTGGVDGGRGWVGDVKTMLLDIGKLEELGWSPGRKSEESVELTAKLSVELSAESHGVMGA